MLRIASLSLECNLQRMCTVAMCQSRRQSREAKSRNYFYGHGQMGCWCLRNTLLGYVVYGTWVRFRFAWNNREQDSFTRFLVLMQHQTRNQFIEQLQLPAWTVTCNFSNFGTNLWSENRSFYFHSSSLPHNKVVKKTNAPDYWTYHSQHDLVLGQILVMLFMMTFSH